MDFGALKNSLLSSTASQEEQVTVNQRHLIDKILARYSTDFTVFRELIQNSNDAGASRVEIVFQGNADDSVLKTSTASSISYKNNGRPFQPEDWSRLRKIAEGNPDEQKIGFFGVGFYSLFSICEDPLVSSGSDCMAFFWKGDQLFTRRGAVPSPDEWTTFYLSLREPMDIPDIKAFGKFIATSLAFTRNVRQVTVKVGATEILSFHKKVAEPRPLQFSLSKFSVSSPNSIFSLQKMHVTSVQLDVVVKDDSNYSLFMRQATGLFGVSLLANYVKEMERTTKKKPPKTTEVHIMWSNYDEYESSSGIRGKNSMFDDLVPSTAEQGRIFIGFPTHQTTGCSIQIAAHLIPTVERESIDFVDKTLNVWNQELLSTTGLLSRIIYADELTSIQNMYTELPKPLDKEMQKWLNSRAAHAMASFSFRPSTPSALVGRICSAYFIKSAPKNPLEIMSTVGVLPVNQVRLLGSTPNEVLLKSFIKRVPVIPDEILSSCQPLISQLESIGSLVKISFADVLSELEARTLETLEMIQCLKWFIEFRKTSAMTEREFQQFLNSAVITFPSAESSSNNNKEPGEYGVQTSHPPRPLAQIKFFSTSRSIPPNLPLPENCLPLEISKNFTNYELESFFGHLVELSLPDWMEYVSKDPAFTTSPFFSEKLLGVCSRAWGSTSNVDKARIISILTPLACLPTTHGMQKPDDAYFKSVTLFEDIPVVFFPSAVDIKSTKEDGNGGSSSKKPNAVASLFGKMLAGVTAVAASAVGKAPISDVFLKSLGVREHVDLQMVFDRLETLNWDHMQLIKYLASVSAKLSEVEIVRLRVTPLFPKELGVPDAASAAALEKDVGLGNTSSSSSSSSSSKTSSSSTRFKAQDLYSPFDELRTIGGLDLIEWKGKWSKSSEEAKLLKQLGLKDVIEIDVLISLANKAESPEKRSKILAYFIENYERAYKDTYRPSAVALPFLPCIMFESKDAVILATPTDCFSDPACIVMGFKAIVPELYPHATEKFRVRVNPPPDMLVDFLKKSPPGEGKAPIIFSYLASRGADFSNFDWRMLKAIKFIPVKIARKSTASSSSSSTSSTTTSIEWMEPGRVFFSGASSSVYQDHFHYVDFGPTANTFLRACGVKDEPTPPELAARLVREPQAFLDSSGFEAYMTVLRQLAANFSSLRQQSSLLAEMRREPFLIGLHSDQTFIQEDESEKESSSLATLVSSSTSSVSSSSPPAAKKLKYQLSSASDIYLIDDTILQQIFQPLGCPLETLLEEMYQELGSKWLSKQVKEVYEPRGRGQVTERTTKLQNLIRDRAALLLYDGIVVRSAKELARNAEKTLKNMCVFEVQEISIVREFGKKRDSQKVGACMMLDGRTKQHVVFVAGEPDYFDVASALCSVILVKTRLNDRLLVSTLLSTSLMNLKRKGFPVDRALNLQANRLKEAEKMRQIEDAKRTSSSSAVAAPPIDTSSRQPSLPPPSQSLSSSSYSDATSPISNVANQIEMLFPDIDRDFLVSEIEKEMQRNKGNQELAAAAVANDLLSRSNTNSIPKCSSRQALTTGQGGRHDGQDETAVNNTLDGGNNNDSTTSSLSGLFNQFTDSIKRTGWGGALLGAGGESGGFSGGGGGGGTSSSIGGDPSSSEVTPQYTKSVQQHLKQSLSSLSSVRQDSFTASIPSDPPVIPTTQASARCSLLAESDLTFITSISGIKVFIEKQATLADIQMVTNGIATRRFIKVIRLLAQVFEVSPHVFHIYWDVASPTVAFNRNRAVFFNLRFYMGLHSHPGGRSSPPPPPLPGGFGGGGASSSTINTTSIGGDEDMLQLQKNDDSDVYYYWFLTACHELAHNFVSPHNAEHEFYMSSFAENYLKKMVSALKQQGISPT